MQDGGQSGDIDKKRRHFLTAAATVVGGAGALATAIPFVSAYPQARRPRRLAAL